MVAIGRAVNERIALENVLRAGGGEGPRSARACRAVSGP